jgi:MscS family membrane protein
MPPRRFLISGRLLVASALAIVLVDVPAPARAQTTPSAPQSSAPAAAPPHTPKDGLGRDTPRGTVLGFLNAARKGENELASQYLRTRLRGQAAADLSHQFFVVLDARLPARLTQLSDEPEGSRANPLVPDQEIAGMIESVTGNVDIVLDRVVRDVGPIWLFSEKTLDAVPALYAEVTRGWGNGFLGRLLSRTRVERVRFLEWLIVLLGLPLFYFATVVLNRILTPFIRGLWRRLFKGSGRFAREVIPPPVRLLLLALAMQWFLSSVSLSLFVRQFWSNAASLVTIGAVVWLLVHLNGELEQYIHRRVSASHAAAAGSLLRLVRRGVDALIIFGGLLAILRLFAVDPTPALAGLGVGGIAVALAAQKTLENVIAGASIIFDQAVRVGDFLRMGEIEGTVDHIGLRSTRIRTVDRTVVSVPNSQIANVSLETMSARDKYWFHPTVGLGYETTSDQLRAVVDGIRAMLDAHPLVDHGSARVRFFRLGSFSLDIDVFAYVDARDWNHFLEIQEQLLFGVTEIVTRAGTRIALPSQTTYVRNAEVAVADRKAGLQRATTGSSIP